MGALWKRLLSWFRNSAEPFRNPAQYSKFAMMLSRDEIISAVRDAVAPPKRETRRDRIIAEMVEADMLSRGPMASSAVAAEKQSVVVKERLLDLELALDNIGWQRQLAQADMEFSLWGITGIIKRSRLYALKNPLVKRGVELSGSYVFGRGITMTSDNEAADQTIQDFLALNARELNHLGLVQKEHTLRTDGNLFMVLFPRATSKVEVRTIDALEIVDIVTSPDDSSIPWLYKRTWTAKTFDLAKGSYSTATKTEWYPDIDYVPDAKPPTIGSDPVNWENPIIHTKLGGFAKWTFGCPDVYASLDWAMAYKENLENFCSITAAHAQFAWSAETKGGTPAIQNIVAAIASSINTDDTSSGGLVDRNPPSTVGSTVVHGPDEKWTPIKTAGMATGPEESRRVGMMSGSALGIPETMLFGDASTGSLATAQSLDRPTELYFKMKQERWAEALQRLLTFVLEHAAGVGKSMLREAGFSARGLSVRMVPRKMLESGGMMDLWEAAPSVPERNRITISIKFPAILEHNVKDMVAALVQGATLDGKPLAGTVDVKTLALALLSEWGVENPRKVADAMYPTASYDPKQPDPQEEPVETPALTPDMQKESAARHSQTMAAITRLREVMEKVGSNGH